jgi:hypothetical protein
VSSTPTTRPGDRVRVTTGLRFYGKAGTVLAVNPYPAHRNRPGMFIATVQMDCGGTADLDLRELEAAQ